MRNFAAVTERKVPVTLPNGQPGTGVDVPIRESTERWSEFQLEDGTVVRAKFSMISAVRVDNEYDNVGNPIYLSNGVPTLAIISVPEKLRRKK